MKILWSQWVPEAWSPKDITNVEVFSLELLCEAFTAAIFSCFCSMFMVINHLHFECHLLSFVAFGWMWAKNIALYTSEFILLLLSVLTKSLIIIQRAWSFGSHISPGHNIASTMLNTWCGAFGSWAVPFLLLIFLFPSILIQVYLGLTCLKSLIPEFGESLILLSCSW